MDPILRTVPDERAAVVRRTQQVIGGKWKPATLDVLSEGERLLSAHVLATGAHVWIPTKADRSATTILLPKEH